MFAHEFIIDSLSSSRTKLVTHNAHTHTLTRVFGLSLVIYVSWLFSHPNYRILRVFSGRVWSEECLVTAEVDHYGHGRADA